MLNYRTKSHLNKAKQVIESLESIYSVQYTGTVPSGFIAQNQIMKFNSIFESLEEALINMYTTDEHAQKQIGEYLITVENLQQQCFQLPPNYVSLNAFYHNTVKEIYQEILDFCRSNHSEIAHTKYTLPTSEVQ